MGGKGAKSMERLDKRSDSGQGYKAVISCAIYRHLPVEERVSMQTLRKDVSSPTGFICSCSDELLDIIHRETDVLHVLPVSACWAESEGVVWTGSAGQQEHCYPS